MGQGTSEKTFAGIAFGADLPAIRSALAEHDFTFVETDGEGDHVFDGTVMGYAARVWTYMAGDRVVKVQVVIGTPDEDALGTFQAMREVLTSRYGAPTAIREVYEEPYRKGDGRAAEAIEAGKGELRVDYGKGLWMEVRPALSVAVHYESAAWEAERERRRTAQARIF